MTALGNKYKTNYTVSLYVSSLFSSSATPYCIVSKQMPSVLCVLPMKRSFSLPCPLTSLFCEDLYLKCHILNEVLPVSTVRSSVPSSCVACPPAFIHSGHISTINHSIVGLYLTQRDAFNSPFLKGFISKHILVFFHFSFLLSI